MVRKAKKGGRLMTHGLFSPPTMKDLASCFSEHAVRVSDTSCSGSSSGGSSYSAVAVVESAAVAASSSALSAVTCLYRTRLSTSKEFLIQVTWSNAAAAAGFGDPSLSIAVDDLDCQISRKKKGSRSYVSGGGSNVAVYWDYSSCRYAGPEPVEEFYVVVIVNAEYALLLGDLRFEEEAATLPVAEFSMVSRREQVIGGGSVIHSTTSARFCIAGGIHEITVRCTGDGWEVKDGEMWVAIDKKKVVHVRRLRWNFRGNQTVFVDGMPVDMMWDVHGWLAPAAAPAVGGRGHGKAVFLFRTRSALESRLWLEEEKGISGGFSLLIETSKNSAA